MLMTVSVNDRNAEKYLFECTHGENWELIVEVNERTMGWNLVFFGVNYVDAWDCSEWKYIPFPIDLSPIETAISRAVVDQFEDWYYEVEDSRIPNLFRCNY